MSAGLLGAKVPDLAVLEAHRMFVLDSDGALPARTHHRGAHTEVHRRRVPRPGAHAGIEPERGKKRDRVAAARAIAAMRLGRIDDETTANVGIVSGGSAPNVVAEHRLVRGERRAVATQSR